MGQAKRRGTFEERREQAIQLMQEEEEQFLEQLFSMFDFSETQEETQEDGPS